MKDYILHIIKVVIVDVIITFIGVLLLSYLLYKFRFGDDILRTGIVIVYVISNFVGGFIIGRIKETKKYIWGAVTGVIYFIALALISALVTGELFGNGNMAMMAFMASVIGGMIGGMVS